MATEHQQGTAVKPPTGPTFRLDPKLLLEFLGAAAGIGALITLVGGVLMWLRFDELGLAADRAVATLPEAVLLAAGLHALAVPLALGLVAVIVLYWANGEPRRILPAIALVVVAAGVLSIWDLIADVPVGNKLIPPAAVALWAGGGAAFTTYRMCELIMADRTRGLLVTTAISLLAVVASLGSLLELRVVPHLLIVAGVGVLGALAIMATQRERRGRPVAWVVFASVLVLGATVAIARTASEPKLEPVAVLLNAPEETLAGFYVGEGDGRIYVAELRPSSGLVDVSAEPVEAIVSVSRDRVSHLAVRAPAGLGLDEGGREEAETLLEELEIERRRGLAAPPAEPVLTTKPVSDFAPLVSLHSQEPVSPTSANYFLVHSRLKWAYNGDCRRKDFQFPLDLGKRAQWARIKTTTRATGCDQRGRVVNGSQFTRPRNKGRTLTDAKGRPILGEDGKPVELKGRQGFYLDIPKSKRKPKVEATTQGQQAVIETAPVYHQTQPEPKADPGVKRITYWFFYPYSIPPGGNDKIAHEGDWERISVLVKELRRGVWQPLSVRYHEHDTHIDVPWSDVRRAPGDKGDTHPRAYVAKGSHATYRRAGKHIQVLAPGGREIIRVKDDARACPKCPLWFTWLNLIEVTHLPWYGFGGAWGQVGEITGTTGPLGPSTYKLQGKAGDPSDSVQPSEQGAAEEHVPAGGAPEVGGGAPPPGVPGTLPPAEPPRAP
jgi:hypothetical protein